MTPCAAALLLAVAGSAASAQLAPIAVSSQIRISPVGEQWKESAVGVRQNDKNEALVMATGTGLDSNNDPVSFIGYATVRYTPGGLVITQDRLGECGGGDVWIAPHPDDGSIWFTALQGLSDDGGGGCTICNLAEGEDGDVSELEWSSNQECPGGLIVGWKEPGATVITDVYTHSTGFQDKPSLAIGGSATTTHYLLRQKRPGNCSNQQHEAGISTSPRSGAGSWTDYTLEAGPNQQGCHYEGWGAAPVVLDASFASDGRVVAVLRDEDVSTGGKYNDNLPYVVYSDDGIDWEPDPDGGGIVTPLLIGDDPQNPIEATTTKGSASDPGDTPFWVDRRNHSPSIAVRHVANDDDEVYVAFVARAVENETNTDIYISRSVNAQASSIDFPVISTSFLQVTDTLLGVADGDTGADQFVPAVAVDGCGGINLMFYDNRHDPDRTDAIDLVDLYYVHIFGFGTGSPTVFQARLTPQSFRVDNLDTFLGDYHNMSVSSDGKTIYAAYIARDAANPLSGDRTCYMHRINLNCSGPLSDFNGDGLVTEIDAEAYVDAWSAQALTADNNLDASVDAADMVDFIITYSAESGE